MILDIILEEEDTLKFRIKNQAGDIRHIWIEPEGYSDSLQITSHRLGDDRTYHELDITWLKLSEDEL
jgi:hypothetical protein